MEMKKTNVHHLWVSAGIALPALGRGDLDCQDVCPSNVTYITHPGCYCVVGALYQPLH